MSRRRTGKPQMPRRLPRGPPTRSRPRRPRARRSGGRSSPGLAATTILNPIGDGQLSISPVWLGLQGDTGVLVADRSGSIFRPRSTRCCCAWRRIRPRLPFTRLTRRSRSGWSVASAKGPELRASCTIRYCRASTACSCAFRPCPVCCERDRSKHNRCSTARSIRVPKRLRKAGRRCKAYVP
jgi:hypothetical protein